MSTIIIHNHSYSFETIKQNGSSLLNDGNSPFVFSLNLTQQWLNGNQTFVFYTSGSTGIPKEIILHRKQLEASALGTINALLLQNQEHLLVCMNTQFIGGAMLLVRGLILGGKITLQQPDGNPLKQMENNHSYTFASFTPLQLFPVLQNEFGELEKLNRFKHILIGGAALTPELENILSSLNVKCYHTYGMTETVSHIALKQIGKDLSYQTLADVNIRTDERGCITIQSTSTNNEWIQTNDLVDIIDNHHFNVLGRADDVINSGGIKVWPTKIENMLRFILTELRFSFSNVCVMGVADEKLGEKIVVLIETENTIIDWQTVQRTLAQNVTKYEIPKHVYLKHHFVYTQTGKINKQDTLIMNNL